LRVCFVAEHPSRIIGGAEVAMSFLADRLVEEGIEVHYASTRCPEHQSIQFHQVPGWFARSIQNAVTYYRMLNRRAASASLQEGHRANVRARDRAVSSKLRRIFLKISMRSYESVLSRVNADVYIQVNAGYPTGYVANFCKKKSKSFIFRSTSLWDADLTFTWGWTTWSEYTRRLYLKGLAEADVVACNSKHAVESFSKHISEDKVRFLPDGFRITPRPNLSKHDGYVLWVGRDKPYKRPSLFADLARRLPAYTFIMVGDIRTIQNPPPNLRLLGPMKPSELPRIYIGAKLVVNTSEVEGFPNVLVEAAIHGVPYVGFFDPDGVVIQHSLGVRPKDLNDMVGRVEMLMGNQDLRLKLGMNARRFVEEHYDIEKVIKKWLVLFEELAHPKK
jgi:glycosyltransferase involved in cell wall biosynthesis